MRAAIVTGDRSGLDLALVIHQKAGGNAALGRHELEIVDDQGRLQLIVEVKDAPPHGRFSRRAH